MLWLVRIHDDDWDYDRFEAAAVWADTAEEADRIMREAIWHDDKLWIENPDWKLTVESAPNDGVALAYFHAG